MMSLTLACSPTTWGVDFAGHPDNPAWAAVLDDMSEAGVHHLELGPFGYLPTDQGVLAAALAARDLHSIGTFLFQPVWNPHEFHSVLATARATCRLIAGQGGGVLVVVDAPNPRRVGAVGQPDVAPRLASKERHDYYDRIAAIAAIAGEYGVRAVLHPHAGTYLEYRDEIDDALAALPADVIGLCIDTGHSVWAGIDPVGLATDHGDRIDHIHLKDIDPTVVSLAVERGDDFWTAIAAGVFVPVGRGVVDFAAFLDTIREVGYAAPMTLEQDRPAGASTNPIDDVIASRAHLLQLGVADFGAP